MATLTLVPSPARIFEAAKVQVVADQGMRPEAAKLPASLLLAACGYPGYGRRFAEAVIVRMSFGQRARQAIDVTQAEYNWAHA